MGGPCLNASSPPLPVLSHDSIFLKVSPSVPRPSSLASTVSLTPESSPFLNSFFSTVLFLDQTIDPLDEKK